MLDTSRVCWGSLSLQYDYREDDLAPLLDIMPWCKRVHAKEGDVQIVLVPARSGQDEPATGEHPTEKHQIYY